MIPLTRPITVLFHDPTWLILKDVADEDHDGKVSDYIRQVVYFDLLKRGKITLDDLKDLRGK